MHLLIFVMLLVCLSLPPPLAVVVLVVVCVDGVFHILVLVVSSTTVVTNTALVVAGRVQRFYPVLKFTSGGINLSNSDMCQNETKDEGYNMCFRLGTYYVPKQAMIMPAFSQQTMLQFVMYFDPPKKP